MKGSNVSETPMGRGGDEKPGLVVYRDESGAVVTDPGQAASGEILEDPNDGTRRRAWFRIAEVVEFDWLPKQESAFLLLDGASSHPSYFVEQAVR
jgi:hypothetical protein